MVVLHIMVNIGVCAQLIYVIPVILYLFVVCKTQQKNTFFVLLKFSSLLNQVMMIVQMNHVHWVQFVLIQKMDFRVFVHHGKMIALMV